MQRSRPYENYTLYENYKLHSNNLAREVFMKTTLRMDFGGTSIFNLQMILAIFQSLVMFASLKNGVGANFI